MRMLEASLTAAVLFALTGPAWAATLYTAPSGFTTVPVTCLAVNIGTKPVEMVIEQFKLDGSLSNNTTAVLAPGTGWAINGSLGEAFYCKFTFDGSKKSVRASACFAGGGGCLSAQ